MKRGGDVVIVDFENRLGGFAESIQAHYISSELVWAEYLSNLLKSVIAERNQEKAAFSKQNPEEIDIFHHMQMYRQVFIFIENLPLFVEQMQRPKEEGVPANTILNMEMVIERGSLHNLFWFGTVDKDEMGTASSINLYKLFVRDKKGIHFGGMANSTAVANMNFDNHDRRAMNQLKPVGRGMLPMDNESSVNEVVLPAFKGL